MKMAVERTATDPVATGVTEFHDERSGIDLQVDCPHDSETYVRTVGGMGPADLGDLSNKQRGDIAEEHVGPKLVRDRGLEIVYLEDSGDTGFDIVACDDSTDEYVIIEAKFRSKSGSVSNSSTWLDRPEEKSPQMTDSWIEETIQEMASSNNEAIANLGEDLQAATIEGRVQKELIIVQNKNQNGKTVLKSLTQGDMDIDRVHIVRLEKVIE